MSVTSCGGGKTSWCVGRWTGSGSRNEKYVVRIYKNGTADVKYHGVWGGSSYSADFKAEWEPDGENVIRLYDKDGHEISTDSKNKRGTYDSDWEMYLNTE